ncbi:MAG TPA: hypothetical protein VGY56_08965 [Verrucomicrobiae bacterium]|nr:hypothetical protein [Verrucomicrobiae bacterium]
MNKIKTKIVGHRRGRLSGIRDLTEKLAVSSRFIFLGFAVAISLASSARAGEVLENAFVRADFGSRGLTVLTDKTSGEVTRFSQDEFHISVDDSTIQSSNFTPALQEQTATKCVFLFSSSQWVVRVIYELQTNWHFASKQISISPVSGTAFMVSRIDLMDGGLHTPVAANQSVRSGKLVRFNDGNGTPVSHGIFLEVQNPYAQASLNGQQIIVSYSPEMTWDTSYGTFVSDRLLVGPYNLSGVSYPAAQIPEWQYIPDGVPSGGPTIDAAELDALSGCVRSFLLWQPTNSTRIHVGWTENDYQIDASTTNGVAEYQRIIEQAAAVGCNDVLYAPANTLLSNLQADTDTWGWEHVTWLGLGQQIRTNAWYPGSNAMPDSVQSMLNFARLKHIKLIAYVYPSLPFGQNPQWTNWSGRYADTGQRSFQDWLLQTLINFQRATSVGGYSFDYWNLGVADAPSSPYAQWFGCRRILEQLRLQIPDLVIDGRQQYQYYGPWTWLAGSYPHPLSYDEQPKSFNAFSDLHWDRVSADRQRWAAWWYRVENFAPTEIIAGYMTHQTPRQYASGKMVGVDPPTDFRIRDWDYLGWKYSLISAIGTAPFNDVVDMIPARDTNEFSAFNATTNAQWMRNWFDWADRNMSLLRNIRPIINQPQLGRVDGTAAFDANGHGFIFLFNPNYRQLAVQFTLDKSIGLTNGGPFVLRQLYPDAEKGKFFAPPTNALWQPGDSVSITMPGADALVLEVTNAPALTQPLLLGAAGNAALVGKQLFLTNVVGEDGATTELKVLLPSRQNVTSVSVDGVPENFQQTSNLVTFSVNFAGAPFNRLQQIGQYDPAFSGGIYQTQITIPSRVFGQLAARKAAWPVPYTADDLLATWLGSYRLLLFVNIADPNPNMAVSLQVDGQPVALTQAYTTIYNIGDKNSLVGWYADLSTLSPDVPHQFRLSLPPLAAGQFQGLFLDNVEATFTNQIQPAGVSSDDFNSPHDAPPQSPSSRGLLPVNRPAK